MAEGYTSDLVFLSDKNNGNYDGQGENLSFSIPTQNRFDTLSGQGNVQPSGKRKKMTSSTGSEMGDETKKFLDLNTDEKLLCLFESINRNFDKIQSFETTHKHQVENLHHVQKKVTQHDELFELLIRKIKMLSYKSIDQEARNRRNNIVFWGISENGRYTNCVDIIERFLLYEMDIDCDNVSIERAHRVPFSRAQNRPGDQKRPIIVKFRDYPNTDLIMEHAYKLKGTSFRVDRDYPKEIADARKALNQLDCVKRARENRVRVQIKYPARLYINNKLEKDMFPGWFENLRESRIEGFDVSTLLVNLRNHEDHVVLPRQTSPVLCVSSTQTTQSAPQSVQNIKPAENTQQKSFAQTPKQCEQNNSADNTETEGNRLFSRRRSPNTANKNTYSEQMKDSAHTQRQRVQNKLVDITTQSTQADTQTPQQTQNKSTDKSTKPETPWLFKSPTPTRGRSTSKSKNVNSSAKQRQNSRQRNPPAKARAPRSQSAVIIRENQDTGQNEGQNSAAA